MTTPDSRSAAQQASAPGGTGTTARVWANAYLLLMFAGICVSGVRVLGSSGVWTLADWLINYSGGFVRRGLPGQIALLVHHLLPLRLPLTVVLFAAALYACLFWCLYRLLRGVRWNFWLLAAFLSPVAVSYPFVSTSGYHKEVLFFAALALLLVRLLSLSRGGKPITWRDGVCLAAVGVPGVLSHELFVIYLPYALAALYLADPDYRRVTRIVLVPVLAMLATFGAVATHPGTPATARAICDSLGPENQRMCGGSIEYIGRTREEGRADTLASAAEYHYAAFLPPLTLLGLLPLVAAFWQLRDEVPRRSWVFFLTGTGLAMLMSVVLFVYGADWGRWIEIHLFSLFLLLLFLSARYASGSASQPRTPARIMYWQMAVLLVYATCWSIPGTTSVPKAGYLSMFSRVGARVLHR